MHNVYASFSNIKMKGYIMPTINTLTFKPQQWEQVKKLAKQSKRARTLNIDVLSYQNVLLLALGLEPRFWTMRNGVAIRSRDSRKAHKIKV
jgi:hypothetical protein